MSNPARSLGIIAVSATLTVAVAWRLHRNAEIRTQWDATNNAPAASATEGNSAAAPAVVSAPLQISKNAQVAAPTVAPVAASEPPPAQPSPTGTHGPQADINTTAANMLAVLQSGDLSQAIMDFVPPDELAQMQARGMDPQAMIQMMQMDPQFQEQMQRMTEQLKQIQSMTPEYSEDGNTATYTFDPPPENGPRNMRFHKINGLWYPQ